MKTGAEKGKRCISIHCFIRVGKSVGFSWGAIAIFYGCIFKVDVTTLKMARKPVKLQRKIQLDALGKVNRIKKNRRRK